MAIQSLSYLNIPLEQRRKTATAAVSRLKERLNDPLMSAEQRTKLLEQLNAIQRWANAEQPKEG